jgi:chromosome partitioning protein
MIISVVSQKGGVGKSALARTLAAEFTKAGWNTLLADCDHRQSTSARWCEKRAFNGSQEVQFRVFRQVSDAIKVESEYDLVIIDGAPHASRGTQQAATASTITVIPTGSSVDDLQPGIALAQELIESINAKKIVFALMKTTSDHQEKESKDTIESLGFSALSGTIPMRSGYIEALDAGLALTETKYSSLNKSASTVVQSAINLLNNED